MGRNDNQKQELQKLQDSLSNVDKPVNPLDVLADFERVDTKLLHQINAEYLSLKPKSTYSFVFTGMSTIEDKKGNEVDCVVLLDKEGNKHVTGGKVLVNNLKKVEQLPCLVKIVTKDLVEGKNGEYMDMDIFTVPIAKP